MAAILRELGPKDSTRGYGGSMGSAGSIDKDGNFIPAPLPPSAPPHRCIGSACMAWRWEDDDVYEERIASWEDAANIGGVQRGPEPARCGHCGLAGKP